MKKNKTIQVKGIEISIQSVGKDDFISLTDMVKAKDGDFFISDWLHNRNTIEFLGIWESVNNKDFNYGEFAIIKIQAGFIIIDIKKLQHNDKTHHNKLWLKTK
jgi:hypothetical protein